MATFSLTGQLRIVPTWTDALSTTDVVDTVTIFQTLRLTDGDGAGEADAYWRDVRTVAATTTDNIVLSALPLSVFGGTGTLDLDEVKLIYIRNLSATTSLRYGFAGGSNPQLPPGGVFLWLAGTQAAGGSRWMADDWLIEIENTSATPAQYEIVLVGVKA